MVREGSWGKRIPCLRLRKCRQIARPNGGEGRALPAGRARIRGGQKMCENAKQGGAAEHCTPARQADVRAEARKQNQDKPLWGLYSRYIVITFLVQRRPVSWFPFPQTS